MHVREQLPDGSCGVLVRRRVEHVQAHRRARQWGREGGALLGNGSTVLRDSSIMTIGETWRPWLEHPAPAVDRWGYYSPAWSPFASDENGTASIPGSSPIPRPFVR